MAASDNLNGAQFQKPAVRQDTTSKKTDVDHYHYRGGTCHVGFSPDACPTYDGPLNGPSKTPKMGGPASKGSPKHFRSSLF